MSLLLVIAGMTVVVLLVCVCAVRSNRLVDEDDGPKSLWLLPARDPVRERREHEERERGRSA